MGYKNKLKRDRKASAAVETPALLGKNPDLVMATVIDIFHKVGHTGGGSIYPAVLLHELVPGSELVKGFGIIDDRLCYSNVWVEHAGETYDPGTAILRVLNEVFTEPVSLSRSPVGPRVDEEDSDSFIEKSIALYRADPGEWWARAPPGMTRIRKFLRK